MTRRVLVTALVVSLTFNAVWVALAFNAREWFRK